MDKTKEIQQVIDELKKQNDILIHENNYLRELTRSKRFRFAEKVATTFNSFFPKSTKQRLFVEKIVHKNQEVLRCRKKNQEKKINKKLLELVKKYDKIMVLNGVPWNLKLRQRSHHLADEFGRLGYFVIYLEFDNPLNKYRKISENIITVNSGEFLIGLPKVCNNCYFLSSNNMPTNFQTIRKIIDYGFKFIYDYLDEFHEDISGNISEQMEVWDNLEELKPVLYIATARKLFDELEARVDKSEKVVLVSNAAVVEDFNFENNMNVKPPADLLQILKKKKPIIGYYGALASWIDYDLLNKIAKKHQEWSFVYLGVSYKDAGCALEVGKNVYNLGAKKYELLPKYAKFFEVAMIPFKEGNIAKATSPVKLFEYMAAGLPTVCTADLDECRGYDFVYVSNDAKSFENNLKKALGNYKNINARRRLLSQALDNTWKSKADIIDKALQNKEST